MKNQKKVRCFICLASQRAKNKLGKRGEGHPSPHGHFLEETLFFSGGHVGCLNICKRLLGTFFTLHEVG